MSFDMLRQIFNVWVLALTMWSVYFVKSKQTIMDVNYKYVELMFKNKISPVINKLE
jgi:hypothetical protein